MIVTGKNLITVIPFVNTDIKPNEHGVNVCLKNGEVYTKRFNCHQAVMNFMMNLGHKQSFEVKDDEKLLAKKMKEKLLTARI